MSDLHEMTAVALGRALRSGEISAVELTRHYLDRITALDPQVHAYVTVTRDLALDQARAAQEAIDEARRSGAPLGPLHGVPIAVKDEARIEDVVRTAGSLTRRDDVSDIDDHVVARLKEAGLVILGTTNMPEFALPCYTENGLGPATRNPWSPEHSPAGSSGGSAAAVAAGLAPLGHGTDAGGSIRTPASACGLVGVKPSRGRVSNGPVDHEVTGLSVHGTLTRTVEDGFALLDVMSGLMPGDTYTAPALAASHAAGRPLRIAVAVEPMVPDTPVHPSCRAACDRAVRLLLDAGHAVEEMEMSPDPGVAEAFQRTWSVVAARIEVEPQDEQLLTPFTRYMREKGREVTGLELHAALSTFRGIGQMLADMVFATYDVILTPTLALPPARIGEFRAGSPEEDFARMSLFMPYTPLANITGLPSVSVPVHQSPEGLPIGVLLTGRYGQEALLAGVAATLEAGSSAADRRPVLW